MREEHPHLGATYKIALQSDNSYGVEVAIPGASLVIVKGFASQDLAAARIAHHQREITTGTAARAKLHLWSKHSPA
jgi:hypothetical protein